MKVEKAVDWLQGHEAEGASSATFYDTYARALIQAGRHTEALAAMEKALRLNPDDPVLQGRWCLRGNACNI